MALSATIGDVRTREDKRHDVVFHDVLRLDLLPVEHQARNIRFGQQLMQRRHLPCPPKK